jgi:hypothetical protein
MRDQADLAEDVTDVGLERLGVNDRRSPIPRSVSNARISH